MAKAEGQYEMVLHHPQMEMELVGRLDLEKVTLHDVPLAEILEFFHGRNVRIRIEDITCDPVVSVVVKVDYSMGVQQVRRLDDPRVPEQTMEEQR